MFLDDIYQTHEDPGKYDLIGTILFGISECTRSESFNQILQSGDLEQIRTIIAASHNGDRLGSHNSNSIFDLIKDKIPLTHISGKWGFSTEDIDQMVDISNSIPGTVGAQLAGAGMGGNIVVLVKDGFADDILSALRKEYYEPKNIPFDAHIYNPIFGASILGEFG